MYQQKGIKELYHEPNKKKYKYQKTFECQKTSDGTSFIMNFSEHSNCLDSTIT